ncbi:PE domain-containing protein [Longimycelium tulufanense]|nr:PE domain-containing protein [Longimycelium tulufanense]
MSGGGGTAKLSVRPENVLQLKRELEDVRDEVRDFLLNNREALALRPQGADPVSLDAAKAVKENADTAVDVAETYIQRLASVIDALDQAAKTYGLVEDTNTANLQQRS